MHHFYIFVKDPICDMWFYIIQNWINRESVKDSINEQIYLISLLSMAYKYGFSANCCFKEWKKYAKYIIKLPNKKWNNSTYFESFILEKTVLYIIRNKDYLYAFKDYSNNGICIRRYILNSLQCCFNFYNNCGRFRYLWLFYPDELNTSTDRDIHNIGGIVKYCPNGDSKDKKCNTDLEKINASLLWLFEQNIVKKIDKLNKEQPKVFIIYFMIWLSHMLTLKKVKDINNLKEFYEKHIKNNTYYINCYNNDTSCSDSLKEVTGYTNYKETIDNEIHFMTIDINNISKFYDAFKLLCNMYNEITKETPECDKYLKYADEFVKKYDDLNTTKDSSYTQIFSTLLTDYNNLKNERDFTQHCKSVTLPEINTKDSEHSEHTEHTEHTEHSELSEHSEVTSSSLSISNKIFIVLSIFSATLIFFGIAYKVNNKEFKNYFN
ncbi:hypothetical protein YYC_05506 [Plasmodium yoelii 17X]|uniref:Uncharacterized protein n=1 Tax=Plasmodium yoelii 17X TaxID=1323249 RepID=V7PD67_PLAYE|nr:hypothetical protein YYC_05506 [Plasmodium yoelii 17X]